VLEQQLIMLLLVPGADAYPASPDTVLYLAQLLILFLLLPGPAADLASPGAWSS
jgi:hypothetical protein